MALSRFHPAVSRWFQDTLGEPTRPQREGWPAIRSGDHTLIAAPTGTGKTLAAFLWAIDRLLREGPTLPDATRILYLSPLKALGNDVQKNLRAPLEQIRARDPSLADLRVLVRSGDTPPSERRSMIGRPPHILVTTPESLYILLTSESGRAMLATVETAIVDEIHALCGDKRGSHLALSLERLEALAGPVQRIGLSATQKPLEDVAHFLTGTDRACRTVDAGHLRELDLGIEIPPSPLSAVCSHETWAEIHERMARLIAEHRTTLVFVNTRKMAERLSSRIAARLGEDEVLCHHGSLSKERRLEAEHRLKQGTLRALVATASLELGIDIGDVDLVMQCGATRSISTFLQRVGRAGHGVGRTPRGRLFPLTLDELVEGVALLRAVQRGELDRILQPVAPLDILAQQIVAACVSETWEESALLARFRRAWPYRDLSREDFDRVVGMHALGRHALLHRDGVHGRLRGTRRARLTAITSGGAIPDNADYRVLQEPTETFVGTLNEDFAIESNAGDIFQLGNTSWQILKVERGTVRVADAHGAPPTIPFWLGEAPGRTDELSAVLSEVREHPAAETAGVGPETTEALREYLEEGARVLGTVPTRDRVILERFFDESGGMQLVVHAPFGSRINRAWGLALRKKFCRGFGFELQAAANEEAIVLSLGAQHSFPLEDVFGYLKPETARETLVQALLATPMFTTRWRWNISRALLLPRMQGGKRLPAPIARMRADDLLAQAFPEVLACPENLPPGDFPVPMDHPLVRQTVDDCLTEAMDVDGFLEVIRRVHSGEIEIRAIDSPEPSGFAKGILNAMPYSFLDDAPLEERRTQAVMNRRAMDPRQADELGALDPEAVARVREEAWPDPRDAEEVHEALLWMGWLAESEAAPWGEWLHELAAAGRVQREGDRWYAAEATRDPVEALRGRMEALGPVCSDSPDMLRLETQGHVLRCRFEGGSAWCDRRLLARIRRYTLERLRREIEPVSAAEFLHSLSCWQRVDAEHRVEGPRGVASVLEQLAGLEAPAAAWERGILARRVQGYRPEFLDQLAFQGDVVWGRLWGQGTSPARATPVAFVRREDLPRWIGLTPPPEDGALSTYARTLRDVLVERGATFHQDLQRAAGLLPQHFESGLAELVGHGVITCDSFRGLRQLLTSASRRRIPLASAGRWNLFRHGEGEAPDPEFVAGVLLRRWGVVFRRLLDRERIPIPWRDLLRVYRPMELRGDVRGGRFVNGFSGEQYALPEAVDLLRRLRRQGERPPCRVAAADPLNLSGILTPEPRVASSARREVVLE